MRTLLLFILFSSVIRPLSSQSLDYEEIFGDDWKKASAWEKDNREWMEQSLAKKHIDYALAISVIFPELIRYSSLKDKMETTMLRVLYINLGREYADFSIGEFQMKPSFAETVREIMKVPNSESKGRTEINDPAYRRLIVNDLEDPRKQINYLIAFIKICENRFRNKQWDDLSKVKFLATVYNYGIDKKESEIDSMINKKFFSIKLNKSVRYSYSDISAFWYSRFVAGK